MFQENINGAMKTLRGQSGISNKKKKGNHIPTKALFSKAVDNLVMKTELRFIEHAILEHGW